MKSTNKQNKSETDKDSVEQWDQPLTLWLDRPSPWQSPDTSNGGRGLRACIQAKHPTQERPGWAQQMRLSPDNDPPPPPLTDIFFPQQFLLMKQFETLAGLELIN